MVVPAAVHLSPGKYDDPLEFNPWRWEVKYANFQCMIRQTFCFIFKLIVKAEAYIQGKELHAGSKTFMAFGGGIRLCVGADFAKLQMAIFIHHMVTKYR